MLLIVSTRLADSLWIGRLKFLTFSAELWRTTTNERKRKELKTPICMGFSRMMTNDHKQGTVVSTPTKASPVASPVY